MSVSGPVTQAGKAVTLRVVAPETAGNKYTESGAFTVTVYGWYYVTEQFDTVEGDWYDTGSFSINAVTYPYTGILRRGVAAIDLKRSCTTFSAVVGLIDTSSSTARYSGRITADTTQKWQKSNLALGQSFPVTFDITGALRLNFYATYETGDSGQVGFGNGAVRCAF